MEPGVTDNPEQARFEIREDGQLAGFVQYRRNGNEITFTHTETVRGFRGRGVAARLVNGALDQAAKEGLRVIPRCPFVRDWIDGHPGYADLVPEGRRAEFGL
jgi:predicted GNAT family acetyltransferase